MVQGKSKGMLFICRGFSKTVTGTNFSTNHNGESCKVIVKGIGNSMMIFNTATFKSCLLKSIIFTIVAQFLVY